MRLLETATRTMVAIGLAIVEGARARGLVPVPRSLIAFTEAHGPYCFDLRNSSESSCFRCRASPLNSFPARSLLTPVMISSNSCL